MKKILLLILLLASPVFASECNVCHAREIKINEEVIVTAKKYLYVREATNHNDAKEIDLWLKNCGLGKGYPYCAAFVASSYKETYSQYNLKSPVPMIAGVARFAEYCNKHPFEFKMISTKKINWGIDKPQVGDIISWGHGKSFNGFNYKGHKGITISSNENKTINTIEGNTKPKDGGDQSGTRLGDFTGGQEGVYTRTRSLGLSSNFPILYFIRINKVKYEI